VRARIWTVLILLGIAAACAPSVDERDAVHVLTYDGAVDPVMERYIDRGIDEAEDTGARAVVIRLDTPGGLVSSMEGIVKRINASRVPVIVWVTPSGAHAASAGTFITLTAHVAAMAPATRIGAASPVAAGGGDIDDTLQDKITEDLAALIRGIAEQRGRNVDWAERAVREAVSASSGEAVEMNIVDFEARTLESLLEQADGRTVRVGAADTPVTLDLADAPVVFNDRTWAERFLALIADPNIAFLLLSLGATGLFIELLNPGLLFPGIFGVIALVIGFFSLGTLPVNWAAVALIVLAFALFVAEVFVSGFGVLGLGGAVALILGGLLLTSTSNPDFQVNRWLIYSMAAVLATFFIMVMSALLRSRRAPAYLGRQSLVGRVAIARSALDPEGVVFLEGARWQARSESGPVAEGERVEVTEVQGLHLTVRKAEER
jgi:membrane-bound serine protease (ClpP class)